VLRLAWRNLWRNRRRALITIASVFFAVFFCLLLLGLQNDSWQRMADNTLNTQAGHIQIHAKEYWEDKTIEHFMSMDAATLAKLENLPHVTNVSPRLETFAMAASNTLSKGVAVLGVSPTKEAQKSALPSRLIKGEYLSENDEGILIGEALSQYLKVDVGDSLALIGQGYQGASAVGLFPIRGIAKLMLPEMDKGLVYLSLPAAQQFIDMPNGYSGVLISIKDNKHLDKVMQEVQQNVDVQKLDVYSWHFTMERLLKQAKTDKAFSKLTAFIMYILVGFGILGTVIMLTNERRREFCVLVSLGMSRLKLSAVVVLELLLMSFMGVALGLVASLLTGQWFSANPIKLSGEMAQLLLEVGMEPLLGVSMFWTDFGEQALAIFVMVALATTYPVRKILKLKPR